MYLTGPPTPRAGRGVRLRRAAHRVFADASDLAHETALRPYLTDLAGRQGLTVREDAFGSGQSYFEMGLPLVESVTSADTPVDLLVLAYGVHDVQPVRSVALHLANRCPGDPLAFAVCDQGPAAAFAALHVIGSYAATGGCGRALLLVAEQSTVHYPLAAPAPVPDRHAMAALLFEVSPEAPALRVRQRPGVPAEAVDAVLAADVAELAGERTDVTLLVDGDTETDGLPYTGLWSRLCGVPSVRRLALLAQYDPTLGYLSVAAIETEPSPQSAVAVS